MECRRSPLSIHDTWRLNSSTNELLQGGTLSASFQLPNWPYLTFYPTNDDDSYTIWKRLSSSIQWASNRAKKTTFISIDSAREGSTKPPTSPNWVPTRRLESQWRGHQNYVSCEQNTKCNNFYTVEIRIYYWIDLPHCQQYSNIISVRLRLTKRVK